MSGNGYSRQLSRQAAWKRAKYARDPEFARRSRAASAAWQAENPERVREMRRERYRAKEVTEREKTRRAHATQQAESVASAGRRGEIWTAKEDRLVMDRSVPLRETALRIGRTFHATRRRRELLLKGERERAASVAAARGTLTA